MQIRDLTSVNIDWKMLTLARPANKMEEDIFSKFVLIPMIILMVDIMSVFL